MSDHDQRIVGDLTVRIDRTLCVGFGDCVTEAPGTFVLDAEDIAVFTDRPDAEAADRLVRACEACPVDAISVWGGDGRQIVP